MRSRRPPPGTEASWDNPNSGNVTLIEAFEYKGLPCHKIHYTFKIKDIVTDFSFVQDRCKLENGERKAL